MEGSFFMPFWKASTFNRNYFLFLFSLKIVTKVTNKINKDL
ncbi:hypothetical protein M2463_000327 [Parabacteroides sp. PH5-13]|nr:hypothetical protein [Parabacteroides sp. PH5-39]MDH6318334.1 hypothetical protein [Parabacteroides sp. PH5-13]MDH6322374.1 hypothetical protein [Parabacteroides sp. PH5-8]MDH6344412.1 hypothetical protein [Parabacteroides sp. PH5-46]MDH6375276.1 hypothetical protein [Parabacteroides sp. PH5-33]MDH6383174.1 hypothetical protein [Parabacteroides sp. PH5-17]MDH6392865.1 hypothetical protein [Parabacteroides sp. PFB2-22]MDH6405640.1 hypothetical protein [Parabacteroides sp. PH5-26]